MDIELGIDGNCAFALLGPNLREGESTFIEIRYEDFSYRWLAEEAAMKEALGELRWRFNIPDEKRGWFYGETVLNGAKKNEDDRCLR